MQFCGAATLMGRPDQRWHAMAYGITQIWPGSGVPAMLSHWPGETRGKQSLSKNSTEDLKAQPLEALRQFALHQVILKGNLSSCLYCQHNPHSTSVYWVFCKPGIMRVGWKGHSPWPLEAHRWWQNRVIVHLGCQFKGRYAVWRGEGEGLLMASWESLVTSWA